MTKASKPEMWEYKEHTRVKHTLLEKYLSAWIPILGKWHSRICYFDGFAGRGEYSDGSLGSPLIALKVANELLLTCKEKQRKPYFDEFICIAIELDPANYANLQSTINKEHNKFEYKDRLKYFLENEDFSKIINQILDNIGERIAPSFFFIDPFGYNIPFSVIKKIMSLPRTEIFFTLMTRDINRFLIAKNVEKSLNELYPIQEWRKIYQIRDWYKRDSKLKDLYIKCLQEIAGVKYVFPFQVCMDERYQTLYYLIHSTNHFDGLKIMKDIMYRQGASGMFAYLGPKEIIYKQQLTLFGDDISTLKHYLLKQYKGTTKTYQKILEETYMYTRFIEKDYKKSLKDLNEEQKIKISGIGPRGGIKCHSRITFL